MSAEWSASMREMSTGNRPQESNQTVPDSIRSVLPRLARIFRASVTGVGGALALAVSLYARVIWLLGVAYACGLHKQSVCRR